MQTIDKDLPADKPTFVIQSHPGMEFGWIIDAGYTGYSGDACLSECLPDTSEARAFETTLAAWSAAMEVQNGFVEDSWFERDRPTPPAFDWDKWELVGVALAIRLSALAGPNWIIKYERAFYGPKPHICLWRSE